MAVKLLSGYQRITNNLVNYVSRRTAGGKQAGEILAPAGERSRFVAAARASAAAGLTAGALSEMSMLLSAGKVLINAADTWLGMVQDQDLIAFSLHGEWHSPEGSLPCHASWHRAVLLNSPAKAAVYLHPASCLAYLQLAEKPDVNWVVDAGKRMGGMTVVPPEKDQIGQAAQEYSVLLLTGFGVLAWGDSLEQAVSRVETAARICDAALLLAAAG